MAFTTKLGTACTGIWKGILWQGILVAVFYFTAVTLTQAQTGYPISSSAAEVNFSDPNGLGSSQNVATINYAAADIAAVATLQSISVTMSICDLDTVALPAGYWTDYNNITLGLNGIDTGILVNGFGNDNAQVAFETHTITGTPNNAAQITQSLKTTGHLIVSIIEHAQPYSNYVALSSAYQTTLTLTFAGVAPTIQTQPVSQTVNAGSGVTFSVVAQGTPKPTYQWYHASGVPIAGATSASYTIPAAQVSDAGSYYVSVQNLVSTVISNTVTLTVHDFPTISSISPQTIQEDNPTGALAFTVGSLSVPVGNLTVTSASSNTVLFPTGSMVLGGGGANRTITLTPAADQNGPATITLSVSDGTVTTITQFTVTVQPVNDAPTLTVVANQTMLEDASPLSVGFTVADVDNAVTSLVTSASSDNPSMISVSTSGTGANRQLIITPLSNQNGTANVTLTVSDGVASSQRTFQVTVTAVNDAPTLSSFSPVNMLSNQTSSPIAFTVGDVDNAASSLTVSASSSNPTLISTSGMVFGGSGASRTLTLTPVASQYGSATITVTVSDGLLTASQTFSLVVYSAPVIVTQPVGQSVTVGTTVILTVSALGNPTPTYQWQKGTTNISGQTGTSYQITNAQVSNTGDYRVIVTNSVQSVPSNVATVTVQVGPGITTPPAGQIQAVGGSATFSVTPSGTGPFTYQWQKDSQDLAGQTGATLSLTNLALTDAGSYTVKVSNLVGTATSAAGVLTVLQPPSIGAHPQSLTVPEGTSATFSVTASGSPTLAYQWRKDGTNIVGATSSTYTIPVTANPGSAGAYTVVVSNPQLASSYNATSNAANLTIVSPVAATWERRNPLPTGDSLNSAAYGNGLFIVAGPANRILTSSDGTSWTTTQLPFPIQYVNGLIFAGGRFVMVGSLTGGSNTPFIISSTDGVTWTQATVPTGATVGPLAYSGSRFVSVPYNGSKFVYSDDGLTWATATFTFTLQSGHSGSLGEIAYANNRFVATGYESWYDTNSHFLPLSATSPDGVTWTIHTYPAEDGAAFLYLAGGNGKFVATKEEIGNPYTAWTSSDGITWTVVTSPTFNNGGTIQTPGYLESVFFVNGQFAVNGSFSNNRYGFITSTDGVSWTAGGANSEAMDLTYGLAFGAGHYVSAETRGRLFYSSTLGDWQNDQTSATLADLSQVIYQGGEFWAVGYDSYSSTSAVVRSTDNGTTWTSVPISYTGYFNGLVRGNGVTVVVPQAAGLYVTTNGTSFTQILPTNYFQSAIFDGSRFVATTSTSDPGGSNFYTSPDGVNWTLGGAAAGKTLWGYYNGYYAASDGSYLYFSADLSNWTSVFSGGVYSFAASGGRYVLTSTNATYSSPDRYTWTQVAAGTGSVAFGYNTFVLTGNSAPYIRTSGDGVTWTDRSSQIATNSALRGIAYGPNTFIAVGNSGGIFRSQSSAEPVPEITLQPLGGSIPIGSSIVLQAAAIGKGTLTYQWLKDGAVVAGATSPTLALSNATTAQTGTYALQVTGTGGTVLSNGAAVSIVTAVPDQFNYRTFGEGSNGWTDIIFASSKFLSVASGSVNSSSDGISWSGTPVTTYSGVTPSFVAYGNGIYAGLDSSGGNWTSTDGVTWVRWGFLAGSSSTATSIAFGNGIFVACGNIGKTYTSTDGKTWTLRTSPATASTDVAYGDNRFVEVGGSVAVSTDGITWTAASVPGTTTLNAVDWTGSAWVAVGGTYYNGTANAPYIITAPTGALTWTVHNTGAPTVYLTDVHAGSGGTVLALSNSGATVLQSLNSGASWTSYSLGTNVFPSRIGFGTPGGNGLFVISGGSGEVWTSATGNSGSWTRRDDQRNNNIVFRAGAVTGSGYVAVAYNYSVASSVRGEIYTSPTGQTWTKVFSGAYDFADVAYGAGKIVAIDGSGTEVYSSNGGSTWQTGSTSMGSSQTTSGIQYLNNRFILFGATGTTTASGRVAYSTDGTTWTYPSLGSTWTSGAYSSECAAYGNGTYVISNSTSLVTSQDGINYTIRTSQPSFTSLTFGNGEFIAIAATTGIVYQSLDGVVWTPNATAPTTLSNVQFADGFFVANGTGGIYTSVDGQTWTLRSAGGGAIDFLSGSNEILALNATYALASPIFSTSYKLTISAGTGGAISPATSYYIRPGATASFTATPNFRMQMGNWLVNGTVVQAGGTTFSTVISADTSVSVTFDPLVSAPILDSQPYSQTVIEGNSLLLSYNVYAVPTATYQWSKDGQNIPGATSTSLAFTPLSRTDAGSYIFTATNSQGTAVSTPVVLTVWNKPDILVQPQGGLIAAGANLTLSVTASGNPSFLTYVWQKGGVPISGQTASTLHLYNLTPANSGDYTVVVTNSAGSTTSSVATVAVSTSGDVELPPGSIDPTFRPATVPSPASAGTPIARVLIPLSDGTVIVGGTFAGGDNLQSSLTRLAADGTPDYTFGNGTGVNGDVYAAVRLSSGKILIGGQFTQAQGVARTNLALLNSDGSVDTSFDPGTGPNGRVAAIAVRSDGNIYIGGSFTSYRGVARGRIAMIDSSGQLVSSFNSSTGFNGYVERIIIDTTSTLYVSGQFTTVNGSTRQSIVRLNDTGTVNTSLAAVTFGSSSQWVDYLALQSDGKLLIGGSFTSVNSTARTGFARLNANGTLDTGINITATSPTGLALANDGSILLATLPTASSGRLDHYSTAGVLDTAFNNGVQTDGSINAIIMNSDGSIFAGGQFQRFNGKGRDRTVLLQASGQVNDSYGRGTSVTPVNNYLITAIVPVTGGKMLVGGSFTTFNGEVVTNLIRLLPDGRTDTSYPNGLTGTVQKMVQQPDGKIIVAGTFTLYGTTSVGNLMRLNADGTLDTAFNPSGVGADAMVNVLTLQSNGKIMIAGTFQHYNGTAVSHLARLNSDGTLDTTFSAGTGTDSTGNINDVGVLSDGSVLVGGTFYSFQGGYHYYLVKLGTNGVLDTTFTPNLDGQVTTILVQPNDQTVVRGGFFNVNSTSRRFCARLLAGGALDTGFDPGSTVNNYSGPLVLQGNGKIVVGDGASMERLMANGSLDTSFDAGAQNNNSIGALAIQSDGRILVGGSFDKFNSIPRPALLRVYGDSAPVAPQIVTQPASQTVSGGSNVLLSVLATGSPDPSYQWYQDGNPVSGATGSFLFLPAVTATSAGSYTVKVSNLVSSVTSSAAVLTVNVPQLPVITTQPVSTSAAVGQTVVLSVAATGSPAPVYQWRKNGTNITGQTSTTLTLTNVSLADAAGYQVVVSNGGGFALSNTANVVVNVPPVITSANNIVFIDAQPNSFAVTATGSPAPTFSATGLPTWATLNSSTGVLSGTPTNAIGSPFSIVITASNGASPNATQNFTLTVQQPLSSWQAAYFSPTDLGNPAVSGPTATPQKDGVPNLLKYLFDIDPTRPMTAADRAALPVVGLITKNGNLYVTLTYRQNALVTGVTVQTQTSSKLASWSTVTPDFVQVLSTDPVTGDSMVQLQVKTTSASSGYIRLNVSTP